MNEPTYPYAEHPARGATVEVAEGARWLTMPMGGSLKPHQPVPDQRPGRLVGHHEDRLLAIEEYCVQPRFAAELPPVPFRRKLDAGHTMMALGEAIAHCHPPMHRNRPQRTLCEDDRYRFPSIDPDLNRRAHPEQHDAPDDQPILV